LAIGGPAIAKADAIEVEELAKYLKYHESFFTIYDQALPASWYFGTIHSFA
jgi:hypothetical protein